MGSRLSCALLALAACGQDARGVEWILEASAEDRAAASLVYVAIQEGSCTAPGEVVFEALMDADSPGPLPPALDDGSYAFRAELRRADCSVITTGCASYQAGQNGALVVLDAPGSCTRRCADPLCAPADGGVAEEDGGAGDAGAPSCVPFFQAVTVAAGANASCVVDGGESLWCWGNNGRGQLGLGSSSAFEALPERVSDDNWRPASLGAFHGCARRQNDDLWCWGARELWSPEGPQASDGRAPAEVAEDTTAVGVGETFACATIDGALRCWGDDSEGQLLAPAVVAAQLAAGRAHACALDGDGAIRCWGADDAGQLGGDEVLGTWREVAAGAAHTCAIAADGRLACWGDNATGQLGDGTREDRDAPAFVGGDTRWEHVAAGTTHTCAVAADELSGGLPGPLFCWGSNEEGQLGIPAERVATAPVQVGEDAWVAVAAGDGHSCAIRADGFVYCWGRNISGQLGDGTLENRRTPTRACFRSGL